MKIYFQKHAMTFLGDRKDLTAIKKSLEKNNIDTTNIIANGDNNSLMTVSGDSKELYEIIVNHIPCIELERVNTK